ncbi:MAG TPA: sulfotransferase [Devosiaceae bacterium]|nr:sulfotransferase [Devosiaceae bacterium]
MAQPDTQRALRKFNFVAGAEGSGTTLLLRLLASPNCAVSLGGNHIKYPPEAKPLVAAFDASNRQLWDRKVSFAVHEEGRERWRAANAALLEARVFAETTRFFFKRSFPFAMPRDQFAPDLWDVYDLWPEAQVIVIYRDPRAAAYSAYRRGFDSDIRRLAVTCSEQLTWIAGQVRAIGREKIALVSYTALCNEPLRVLEPLAARCELPFDEIKAAAEREGMKTTADDRWAHELDASNTRWLNEFFDARRLRQWEILTGGE